MILSLHKIANVVVDEHGVATCNVSERCFLPHLYFSLFHCFTSRSVEHK